KGGMRMVNNTDLKEDSIDQDDEMMLEDSDTEINVYDADLEDLAEAARAALRIGGVQERLLPGELAVENAEAESGDFDRPDSPAQRGISEMIAVIEALIFVSDEPLSVKTIADVLKEDRGWIEMALAELAKDFNGRQGGQSGQGGQGGQGGQSGHSGLMLREVAGGWQIVTRPEHHEQVRAFLRSRPSARLSLAALETLAVIGYRQPITVPEILEIRGVQSSSAIKTLLDKRLIMARGRKETVGRPMMYGTSKEFLLQFGLKDLSELPSIEDFEDLTGSSS
ncbi:MAG: SMC-Scp complex subunit ScpB, partial [Pyrinomonadaceae bacterium]